MKYLLILFTLLCPFTNLQAQNFEQYAEIALVFEDSYDINKTTCFRGDTVFEVWMSPKDSMSAVPVTVLTSNGRLIIPFAGFDTYEHFFVDQQFVFYQTYDGVVGRYDFEGNHKVYSEYIELFDVRDGRMLVRRKDNMVGLVTRWNNVIVPFEYFHAWRGIQDDGKILFSRGTDTWTYDINSKAVVKGIMR